MSIPPLPSRVVANLVLGYLAEEELMIAYDEFLQASPYLDAFRNEHDRVFMSSLRNILAEYSAVKLYVETCRPLSLRRRLRQCSNLLEIVKFLIQKLNTHVCGDKTRNRENHTQTNLQLTSEHADSNSFESAVETTPLADLSEKEIAVEKKHVKILEKENSIIQIDLTHEQNDESLSSQHPKNLANAGLEQSICNTASDNSLHSNKTNSASSVPRGVNVPIISTEILKSSQNIDKLNILHMVCNSGCSDNANNVVKNNSNCINNEPRRMSAVGTFQDFATNNGGSQMGVPHSNIPENCNMRSFTTSGQNMAKGPITTQYLFKIGSTCTNNQNNQFICTNIKNLECVSSSVSNFAQDQKIKILSDIRMESSLNDTSTKPPVLKNVASNAEMRTQSIVINGIPAYRPTTLKHPHTFTKDEIMAMPTIILTPSSVPPKISTICVTQTVSIQTNNNTATITNVPLSLEPLTVDVTSCPIVSDKVDTENKNAPTMIPQNTSLESNLVKTVDLTNNATVPKTTTCANESDTPVISPPKRKSSSTPRRTSHIRVLNFTTPRRIFHETINENERHPNNSIPEVVISQSPNVNFSDTATVEKVDRVCYTDRESVKENSLNRMLTNKKSWDTELRALVVTNNDRLDSKPKCNSNSKVSKKKKRNRAERKSREIYTTEEENSSDKNKTKSDEINEENQANEVVKIPIKPTINIITGITQDHVKSGNSRANEKEQLDTPEIERLSLQNAIGTKLNISDILETPYKQALYDIQMETPRFLGSDLPDEPISDIKISNIPTPRFLVDQPTPSSLSTRPTDYSSGGSYYKPDDQDYKSTLEEFKSPETTKEKHNKTNNSPDKSTTKDKTVAFKSSRPVRKCTKNVSYYNLSNFGSKIKDTEDKIDALSSCNDLVNNTNNRPNESKIGTELKIKPAQIKEKVQRVKADKKDNAIKKRRSTVKKETPKSFMKIKPRRLTPTKGDSILKKKITICISPHNVTAKLPKKRIREKTPTVAPLVALAPTKSRRKSSTPRKLNCTKIFHSESSGHDSPEGNKTKESAVKSLNVLSTNEAKIGLLIPTTPEDHLKPSQINLAVSESDDISKIQEYIETSTLNKLVCDNNETNLHDDLIKRGFDVETAKIIERDLLDTPLRTEENEILNLNNDKQLSEKTGESQCSTTDLPQDEADELEISTYECNEESNNFITYYHDESKDIPVKQLHTLRDKYSMEVCIEDVATIRVRLTPFSLLFDQDPQVTEYQDTSYRETNVLEPNFKSRYTPPKDARAQCYEIFDSTLTSLDTPLKVNSSKSKESKRTSTESILEVEEVTEKIVGKYEFKNKEQSVKTIDIQSSTEAEKEIMNIEVKEKIEKEPKKRKRQQSSCSLDDNLNDSKRPRLEPKQYILKHTNIKNFDIESSSLVTPTNIKSMDIESVLSRLHGPNTL